MKHYIFAFLMLCFGFQVANAQRTLVMQDETNDSETFNQENMAGVIIHCNTDLIIRSFVSNMDKEVRIEQSVVDDENGEVYHCLVFSTKENKGRILTLRVDGYNAFDLNLNLEEGRMYRYRIYDSDKTATNSFFDQHTRKGQSYYDGTDYLSAREEFLRAKNWSEATEANIAEADRLIANCDTLLYYRHLGFQAFDCFDFDNAIEYLSIAMKMNPSDHNIIDKLDECYSEQQERCRVYLESGDNYYKQKEYADAVLMYQKVQDRNCDETVTALKKMITAQTFLDKRTNYSRYAGFEYNSNLYGVTFASYKKYGGTFFSLRTNTDFFDALRESSDKKNDLANLEKKPEINTSIGWTIPVYRCDNKIFHGVWAHLTPFGFTGVIKYSKAEEDRVTQTTETTTTKLNKDWGFAISPELGVAIKVWHLCLRASYQLSYSLTEDFEDVIDKNRLYFGVGICW